MVAISGLSRLDIFGGIAGDGSASVVDVGPVMPAIVIGNNHWAAISQSTGGSPD
jgi:hypothetical protein